MPKILSQCKKACLEPGGRYFEVFLLGNFNYSRIHESKTAGGSWFRIRKSPAITNVLTEKISDILRTLTTKCRFQRFLHL